MRSSSLFAPAKLAIAALVAVLPLLALVAPAQADVFGTLRITVKSADDEKPISGAKVTLHDSAGVRPDIILTTDAQGVVVSPSLEIRTWQVLTQSDLFKSDQQDVQVAADTTTNLQVLLEPIHEKVITITSQRQLVTVDKTASGTQRDRTFMQKYPTNAGNPQSLSALTRAVAGFAEDSVNQSHPRGEHSSTTISINGFALPGALQGEMSQVLTPEDIQSADILTGAYAPEYGGETAAVLNLSLRSGPIDPFRQLKSSLGGYNTRYGELALGGQIGKALGPPDALGNSAKQFGYFIDLNARRTDNAVQPPQPDDQTAHNQGATMGAFGHFDYSLDPRNHFSLSLSTTPAYTQIANRTGLPASFASVGQGFGYAGHLSAAQAANQGIASQQADGQDINQRDANEFSVLDWRRQINDETSSMLSVGLIRSGFQLTNGNPAVNLSALPADSSIEFNPTLTRNSRHTQVQGSITSVKGKHTFKAGALYDAQSGNELYQFIPASQLALDALAGIDTRLVPAGTLQVDGSGNPLMDSLGNQIYQLAAASPVSPTLTLHRSGAYKAAYVQDTWTVTRKLTANYGLRLDSYNQTESISTARVDKTVLSPRINLAYLLGSKTVARVSYNRLFTEPPLAQGAILGNPIQPELANQYEVDLDHQLSPRQKIRLSYYIKHDTNQIDTGILIPGTQIGAYTAVNFDQGHIRGFELTYDLLPPGKWGWSSYLTWANSLAKPSGFDNTGAPVPIYNDHDQLNTINVGSAYSWKSGASVGADMYYGTGTASSIIFNGGPRTPHTEINLDASTGDHMLGPKFPGGLSLAVENLFNSTQLINFNSGFSGTRFQQGRTVLLTAFWKW